MEHVPEDTCQVDGSLLSEKNQILQSVQPEQLGRGFGARANESIRKILELPMEDLLPRWEAVARLLLAQKMALDDEVNKRRELSVRELILVFGLVPSVSVFKLPSPGGANQEDP